MSDYRILVDLDALFDTRIGTLATIDEEMATRVVMDPRYGSRETDVFSKLDSSVDDNVYSDRYLKRDEATLAKSLISDVIFNLGIGLRDLGDVYDRGVMEGGIEVVVNFYPYVLSKEKQDIILDGVGCYLPITTKVKAASYSPWSLSPSSLNGTYSEWYCYDIEPWLAVNSEALLVDRAIDIKVQLPLISTSGVIPEPDEIVPCPFKAREMIMREFIDISYNPVSLFSANVKFIQHINEKLGRSR